MRQATTRRRLLSLAAATAGATGLSAPVSGVRGGARSRDGGARTDDPFVVLAAQFQFVPQVLTVPEGASVMWQGGRIPHTVTSSATREDALNCEHNGETTEEHNGAGDEVGVFDYYISQGERAHHTFAEAGNYPYFCRPHCDQRMVGEIVVV